MTFYQQNESVYTVIIYRIQLMEHHHNKSNICFCLSCTVCKTSSMLLAYHRRELIVPSMQSLWRKDDAINGNCLQQCHCAFLSFTSSLSLSLSSLPCLPIWSALAVGCIVFSKGIWIDTVSGTLCTVQGLCALLPFSSLGPFVNLWQRQWAPQDVWIDIVGGEGEGWKGREGVVNNKTRGKENGHN